MNLTESNNFFRESFRGFNKDDVAEYIAKLSKDYTANEDKYKEHIAKLTAEIKAKTDELAASVPAQDNRAELAEIEQKHKGELNRLALELSGKDNTIGELQLQLESLGQKCANLEKENASLRDAGKKNDSETLNQLSFQLAGTESEKMYLLNLIRKIVLMLDIDCVKGRNIEYAASISDIAPKSVISEEIEAELRELAGLRDKSQKLETSNAGLREKIAGLEADLAELRAQPAEPEDEAVFADEQKMYESITADLGGIIYSAKKTAEDIIAKAKADADTILDRARFEAETTVAGATVKRDAIVEENRKNMKGFKEKYEFIRKVHTDMLLKYEEISEDYTSRLTDIRDTINILYDSLDEGHFYD